MTKLTELQVLALDCQATGANPLKGHLLEIAWVPACASEPGPASASVPQSYLVRLPDNAAVPRAVQRLTGIADQSLATALPSPMIWQHLLTAAGAIAAANHSPACPCPLVIHFARFETPFLKDLHRRHGAAGAFPFGIICTHEIAVRLLPNLPRRGIRAIAGYYGYGMPELKRSGCHAAATAFIWQKMVELLNAGCGISNLVQLTDWLASTRPTGRSTREFPMHAQLRRQLPDTPGIYRMLRSNGELLYIGKAKSLKKRISGYFQPKAPHAEHTLEMLTQARGLDITRTGSALEAAILESDEIKRHSPPYNIALRRLERRLVFCRKDLRRQAAAADEAYSVGPLPAGKSSQALAAFGQWYGNGMRLEADTGDGIGCAALGLPPEHAPEGDCFQKGFDIFRRRHGNCPPDQSALRFLTALGARLWLKKAAAAAGTTDAAPPGADAGDALPTGAENEFIWTPEAVASAIETMVTACAFLIRRARWLCLLSESTLAWESADQPGTQKAMLVFEKGRVIGRRDLYPGAKTAVPPGFARTLRARQMHIDLITYDRLRVVTTEMRRIIAAGRNIELRLGPQAILRRPHLIKALQWV